MVLVRDVMTIGVPTCRTHEACGLVAARLRAGGERAAVVVALDEAGRAVGWASRAAVQAAAAGDALDAILDEDFPAVAPDIPCAVAALLLRDRGAEFGFLMHSWPGEPRPAAFVSRWVLEQQAEVLPDA